MNEAPARTPSQPFAHSDSHASARSSELPVLSHYYELFVGSYERAEGFPKVLRGSLTLRFQLMLLDGLEQLLELRYTRERGPIFRQVNMTFEKLRYVSRALKDRRALSLPQYEHFHRQLGLAHQRVCGRAPSQGPGGALLDEAPAIGPRTDVPPFQ